MTIRPGRPAATSRFAAACGADERAGEVDVDDALPLGELHLEERRLAAVARVVDERVEAAELVRQLVDGPGRAGQVVQVELRAPRSAGRRPRPPRAATCARSSSRCQVIPTSKPRAASLTAVARPMPLFPPVTIATGMPRRYPTRRDLPSAHRRPRRPPLRRPRRALPARVGRARPPRAVDDGARDAGASRRARWPSASRAEARIRAGSDVVDVGCGYGATARLLARERGATVTGLTLSAAQAARRPAAARRHAARARLARQRPRRRVVRRRDRDRVALAHARQAARVRRARARACARAGGWSIVDWLARERPGARRAPPAAGPDLPRGPPARAAPGVRLRAAAAPRRASTVVGVDDLSARAARTWTVVAAAAAAACSRATRACSPARGPSAPSSRRSRASRSRCAPARCGWCC